MHREPAGTAISFYLLGLWVLGLTDSLCSHQKATGRMSFFHHSGQSIRVLHNTIGTIGALGGNQEKQSERLGIHQNTARAAVNLCH
nr:uncharacterized protein LOC122173563 [Chrysemys picta bellii]